MSNLILQTIFCLKQWSYLFSSVQLCDRCKKPQQLCLYIWGLVAILFTKQTGNFHWEQEGRAGLHLYKDEKKEVSYLDIFLSFFEGK